MILSVSVASYNIEKYVDTCLKPFADQLFNERLEVLIIDDGSSDSTGDKARKYVQEFPRIFKYVYKENNGWGSTINTGIHIAKGKFFKQLDGDDFFNKESLISFLEFLENTTADIVYTDFATFNDGKLTPFKTTNYKHCFTPGKLYYFNEIEDPAILPEAMHTITVKTSLLKDNYNKFLLTERCFYTDVEYWIKTVYLADSFIYFDTVIYLYRVGESGQSVSKIGIRKHYKEHRIVLENCIFFLNNNDMSPAKREIIRNRLTTMAANQYQFYLFLPINKQTKKELMEFDKWMKREASNIVPYGWKRYEILNKSAFLFYPFAAIKIQKGNK